MANNIVFKVCCRCFTFNHSNYITDTMNGFCIQETDFPFVCCIVDDASTDGEQGVICKYVDEYFDVSNTKIAYNIQTDYANIIFAQHKVNKNCFFAVVLLKENLYSKKQNNKKMQLISEWRDICEYEAVCEGDDYWIDKDKINRHVHFLNNHPEYGLVHARSKTFNQENNKFGNIIGSNVIGYEGILKNNSIVTLTTIYRTYLSIESEDFWKGKTWQMGDKKLWLYIATKRKIKFDNRVVAVYRVLNNSASSRYSWEARRKFINDSFDLNNYFITKANLHDTKANENRRFQALLVNDILFKKYTEAINTYNLIDRKSFKDRIIFLVCLILSLPLFNGRFR